MIGKEAIKVHLDKRHCLALVLQQLGQFTKNEPCILKNAQSFPKNLSSSNTTLFLYENRMFIFYAHSMDSPRKCTEILNTEHNTRIFQQVMQIFPEKGLKKIASKEELNLLSTLINWQNLEIEALIEEFMPEDSPVFNPEKRLK